MAQRIVGLDLGSASVKVVHLEGRGRGDFEVLAYDSEPLGPATRMDAPEGEPVVVPLEERHKVALRALAARDRLEGDVFVTGLPGDTASLLTLTFPFSDARKIEQTIPFELESEIPFDLEDIVYSWMPLGRHRVRDADEVATESHTDVLVCLARREAVADHLALLEEVGVDPRRIEFDALALSDLFEVAFRAEHEEEEASGPRSTPGGTVIESGPDAPLPAVAMVDIGHRRTSVCVLSADRVISAHTILHGGADATRALAQKLGLPPEEAERGKRKEAFIEVIGATAQFSQQKVVSDILKGAYGPVVKRLRQIFQAAMSSSRVRVVKVILTGGGSRVLNLDRFVAEALNVRVVRGKAVAEKLGAALPLPADAEAARNQGEVPEAAGALSYALSGMLGDKSRTQIDFRSGEFAWHGDYDFVKERVAAIGVWAAALLVLMLVSSGAQAWVLGSEEDELLGKQLAACKSITGMEIDSPSRCLAIIQERVQGAAGFALPDMSAADHYLEVTRRIPDAEVLQRKVTELDITSERVRMKANTTDFDAVDKIVAGLSEGRCFASVEKGKARNVKSGVEFNVNIRLNCEEAPGKPLPVAETVADETKKKKKKAKKASKSGPRGPKAAAAEKARSAAAERRAERAERVRKRKEGREGKAPGSTAEAVKDSIKRRIGRNPLNPDGDDPLARRERNKKVREQGDTIRELEKAGKIDLDNRRGGRGRPRPGRALHGKVPALPTPAAPAKKDGE